MKSGCHGGIVVGLAVAAAALGASGCGEVSEVTDAQTGEDDGGGGAPTDAAPRSDTDSPPDAQAVCEPGFTGNVQQR